MDNLNSFLLPIERGRPHAEQDVSLFSDAWNMRQAHPLTGGGTTVTLKPARITSPSPTSQTETCPRMCSTVGTARVSRCMASFDTDGTCPGPVLPPNAWPAAVISF